MFEAFSLQYMVREVFVEDEYKSVRDQCRNKKEDCSYWASTGECEKNVRFMLL